MAATHIRKKITISAPLRNSSGVHRVSSNSWWWFRIP